MQSTPIALAVAVGLSAGACAEGGGGPEEQAVVRRDSSGVEIVETTRAAWLAGTGRSLSPEPELVIGQLDGEAPYLFGEVTGAVRLDDGSVAVTDNQARELRYFDPSGTFIRAVGGAGEGPSEFRTSALTLERFPFGRAVRFAASGGRVFLGTGEGLEVAVHEEGRVRRIQRALGEDLALDQTTVDAFFAAELDDEDERGRAMVR